MTTQELQTRSKTKGAVLLALVLGTILATLMGLAGTAREADAAYPGTNGRIAFQSDRTSGIGVDNPTGDYEIFSMKKDGTGLKQLTFNTSDDVTPSYSANGGAIVFASQRDGNKEIYVMNPDGSNQQRITNNTVDDESPTISPDGVWIAFDRVREIEYGTEGKKLSTYEIIAWAAGNEYNLTNNDLNETQPVYSPDGSKIAFESDRAGGSEIFVMNADGSGQTRLTLEPTRDLSPTWTPDGKNILFVSQRDGNYEIYTMLANGALQTNLSRNPANDRSPAVSPGGKKIAFSTARDGNYEVYTMGADGSNPVNLTNNPAADYAPAYSPDGSKIAFASTRSGNDEIHRMNRDGSSPKRLTRHAALDSAPAYSPDGKKIAFWTDRKGDGGEVYVMNALDGSMQQNRTNTAAYDAFPDWAVATP
jgi:Tol biopolymer transport system component